MEIKFSTLISFILGALICYAVFFFRLNVSQAFYQGQVDVLKQLSILDLQKSGLVKPQEIKK